MKKALIAVVAVLAGLAGLAFQRTGGGQLPTGVVLLYQATLDQNFAAPAAVCAGACAGGTWSYKQVIFDAYGNILAISGSNGSATNATTLTGVNKNTVTCAASYSTYDGNVATCNIYRTASAGTPANLSLVCSAVALGGTCVDDGSVNTATVTPGNIVGTGAQATFLTYPLAANVLQAGKCVVVRTFDIHMVGTTGQAYQFTYGGTTLGVSALGAAATNATQDNTGIICNKPGSTTSQSTVASYAGVASAPINMLAINSGTTQNILAQFNVASTDSIRPYGFMVELRQ